MITSGHYAWDGTKEVHDTIYALSAFSGEDQFLRERKALYIVGTPKSELRHFEASLLEEQNWIQV